MRYLFWLLAVFSLTVFVLLDSKALEFRSEVLDRTDLIERQAYKPEFHGDRLQAYFNKLVSKFSK